MYVCMYVCVRKYFNGAHFVKVKREKDTRLSVAVCVPPRSNPLFSESLSRDLYVLYLVVILWAQFLLL